MDRAYDLSVYDTECLTLFIFNASISHFVNWSFVNVYFYYVIRADNEKDLRKMMKYIERKSTDYVICSYYLQYKFIIKVFRQLY